MQTGMNGKEETSGKDGESSLGGRRPRRGVRGPVSVKASLADFNRAQEFVDAVLDSHSVSKNIASETMLLFEALFETVVSQLGDDEAELELSAITRLGRTDVVMSYAGPRFKPPASDESDDPTAKMIEAFSDRLSYSYHAGDNSIQISVCQSSKAFLLPNLIAVALAIVVSIPLYFLLSEDVKISLSTELLGPLSKLFTNAVMMIGAPMTLFSLLRNATNSFILAGRGSSARRLLYASLASSSVGIVLATIIGFVVATIALGLSGVTDSIDLGLSSGTFATVVDEIIPSSIVDPFETISPVPMIVVALLITYALFSIGPSFDMVKKAIDACYELFSRVLNIVMSAFPVACFVLFLDLMLAGDGDQLLMVLFMVVVANVAIIALLAFYAIRLKVNGIDVREFFHMLGPLVKENYAIGSVIDAVPFNVRYCAKNFGFSRKRLEKELPVLAQTSLDGNCFIIMLLTMLFIFLCNCEVSLFNIIVAAAIVLFMSFGAPNQPGSILIGMFIVFAYLNTGMEVGLALFFELFCGNNQNIINVISSIVTVAEDEARAAKGVLS